MKDKNTVNVTLEPLQFGMELLDCFLQIPYVKNNIATARETNYIINRLSDKSFKVAVVGEFSSGKSTFLNAIIGKDYLTHGVKETTATVTMLVNTKKQDFGRVTFSDGSVKTLNDYSQLKEVTTTQSAAYQVSSQIDLVELFVPFMDTEVPVVLVDTPGLNGVAAMHRERTIDIIQGVHTCIYMLQSRGISETDKKALQWIGQYQRELIIVQNFIDDINKSEGDTLEDILDKQRKILAENVFVEYENVNYTVCGVSAMKALAAKDTSIERLYNTDTFALTETDRQRLYSESNFEQAINSISQFMEYSFQRSHLSALHSAYNLLERTTRIISSQFEIQNALWAKSDDAQIVLRTQQLLDNWDSRREENEKKLKNFIVSKMKECERLVISESRRLIEEVKNDIPNIFGGVNTPEEWDEFNKNKVMESAVAHKSIKIKRDVDELIIKYSENTHNLAILRIQEYVGLTDVFSEQSLPNFQAKINDSKLNPFSQEENDIVKEETKLQELQQQKRADEYKKIRLYEEEHQLKDKLNQERQKQQYIQSDYDSKKRRLGEKPEASKYFVEVTDYEYRGGFLGGIADFFAGPKKITRQDPRWDYTAQNQWVDNERQIKNAYNRQKAELNAQLNSLEQGISSTNQQINDLNKSVNADVVRIDRKKAILQEMIDSLRIKKTLAAKEYVQRQKDKLRDSVCEYLSNTLQQSLTEIIANEINQIIDKLSSEVCELYIDMSHNQKENLLQMMNENHSDDAKQQDALKRDMNIVIELKKQLEVYLCKQQMQLN